MPAIYPDDESLISYLESQLIMPLAAELLAALPEDAWLNIIRDLLALVGKDAIDQVAGRLAELAGRLILWQRLEQIYLLRFNFSADGASYSVSDVYTRISAMTRRVEAEAISAGLIAPLGAVRSAAIPAVSGW